MLILVGTVVAFFSDVADIPKHQGWLLCNGDTFDYDEYPELKEILKSDRTPDLRGCFLRGLDLQNIVDPEGSSRKIGHKQGCSIQRHSHKYKHYGWADSGELYDGGSNAGSHESTTDETGGSETRPVNIAVNYLIYAGSSQRR